VAKTLMLLRHAKSAQRDDVPDRERPLAGRGRRDAPAAGRWLRENDLDPQLALVSSARRAVETFELLAAELATRPRDLVTSDAYAAGAGELLELVRGLPQGVDSALVVGHNPAIETLAALLDQQDRPSRDFPTSAIAVFELATAWADVEPGTARLTAFAVPRG
jgi:phosphohistidine phosphatase